MQAAATRAVDQVADDHLGPNVFAVDAVHALGNFFLVLIISAELIAPRNDIHRIKAPQDKHDLQGNFTARGRYDLIISCLCRVQAHFQ